MKKILLVLLAALVVGMLLFERGVALYVEPKLEGILSDLFGMKVEIKGLRIRPYPGHVWASRITFMNQPEFAPAPHLDAKRVDFGIDFLALARDNRVDIDKVVLHDLVYFIDRISTPEGPRNNIITWYRHMRPVRSEEEKKAEEARKSASGTKRSPWSVSIREIQIRNGRFLFHDRSGGGTDKKLFFQDLEGSLLNFYWPTEDPAVLTQKVILKGTAGETLHAPFWIQGLANFATGKVSFDLRGDINGGGLLDYRGLWEGLPIEILSGNFNLRSHVVCIKKMLSSENDLVLQSLRVKAASGVSNKIWGLPLAASVGFLQSQQTIILQVSVHGDIADPKFEFAKAFRQAFQEELQAKTGRGIRSLVGGTTKILSQTGLATKGAAKQTQSLIGEGQAFVEATSSQLARGVDKI